MKPIAHLLLFALTLISFGCSEEWIQKRERNTSNLLELFSSSDVLERSSLHEIALELNGKKMLFHRTGKGEQISSLATIMSGGQIASGDVLARGGANCHKVGVITVNNPESTVNYDLLKSGSNPHLYAVEVPQLRSSGASLIYFIDSENYLDATSKQ